MFLRSQVSDNSAILTSTLDGSAAISMVLARMGTCQTQNSHLLMGSKKLVQLLLDTPGTAESFQST